VEIGIKDQPVITTISPAPAYPDTPKAYAITISGTNFAGNPKDTRVIVNDSELAVDWSGDKCQLNCGTLNAQSTQIELTNLQRPAFFKSKISVKVGAGSRVSKPAMCFFLLFRSLSRP
jgi:hypothetical protein